eukprot:scaffold1088_cov247-Pinguiococcus_pyrenoidosus.AAC.18
MKKSANQGAFAFCFYPGGDVAELLCVGEGAHVGFLYLVLLSAAEASLLDAGIVENPITPGIFREESSRQVAEVDADHSDGATIDPADSTAAAEPQTPPMPLKYLYGLTLVRLSAHGKSNMKHQVALRPVT